MEWVHYIVKLGAAGRGASKAIEGWNKGILLERDR